MRFFDLLRRAVAMRAGRDDANAGKADGTIPWRTIGRLWRRLRGGEKSLSHRVAEANRTLNQADKRGADGQNTGGAHPSAMEAATQTETSKTRTAALKSGARPMRSGENKALRARTKSPRAPLPRRGRPAPQILRRAPLRSLTAEAEEVLIHAVERPSRLSRSNSARAIVLIHGAGVDHRDWTFSFIDKIDPSWRVLAFDRPGFGASTRRSGAASALPANQARLLRKAAESFDVEEAIVVGHSWGGAVAMAWGLGAPENTLGVASLAGAVAPWSLSNAIKNGRRMRSAAMTAFGEGGMRAAALEAMADSFAPQSIPKGYVEHMATELNPLVGPAAATMADVSTINGALALMTPNYAGFQNHVELVYGDADEILSPVEQGEKAAEMLPNAKLTVLRGAGHMLHHSHPKQCLAALQRLISASRPSRKN